MKVKYSEKEIENIENYYNDGLQTSKTLTED
jgi:hypothetical protein